MTTRLAIYWAKMGRGDKREDRKGKVGEGSWERTKGVRKRMSMGSECVMDREGRLQGAENRAETFREKLEGEVWNPGKSVEEILREIPDNCRKQLP